MSWFLGVKQRVWASSLGSGIWLHAPGTSFSIVVVGFFLVIDYLVTYKKRRGFYTVPGTHGVKIENGDIWITVNNKNTVKKKKKKSKAQIVPGSEAVRL